MKLDQLKKKYVKNGYIIIKIFNNNDLKVFKGSLAKIVLISIKKNYPNHYYLFKNKSIDYILNVGMIFLEKKNHGNLVEIYNSIHKTNFFQKIINNKKLINIINFLLGKKTDNPLFYNSDSVRMDVPNDKKFLYGWHRDSKFNLYNSNFVQLWSPVVNNINKKNKLGGLEILSNSHLANIDTIDPVSEKNRKKNELIRTPLNTIYKIYNKKKDNKIYPKMLYAKTGEVILFSNFLIHRSSINRSINKVRYVLNTFYHDLTNEKLILEDLEQRTSDWEKVKKN